MKEYTKVASNPLNELTDDQLKRKFSNLYADIHVNGLQDGLFALSALKLIENELIDRGYNPADHIGPKVNRN